MVDMIIRRTDFWHLKASGSSVIEILIATLVVGTVLTSLAFLMSMNIKNNAEAELRKQASVYAQNGVELVRNIKATSTWEKFVDPEQNGLVGSCDSVTRDFAMQTLSRDCTLVVDGADSNKAILTVSVSWGSTGQTVTTQHIFYNR